MYHVIINFYDSQDTVTKAYNGVITIDLTDTDIDHAVNRAKTIAKKDYINKSLYYVVSIIEKSD